MMRWLIAASFALFWVQEPQQDPKAEETPAASQPASKPASRESTFRKPAQVKILEELLQQRDAPAGVWPLNPAGEGPRTEEGAGAGDRTLLLEGTTVSDRPGRYVRTEEGAQFDFHPDDSGRPRQIMEILPSQQLEMMERSAEAGATEFVISGEVTIYRGENYLLLRKVLRRVPNRNLGP